jgi:hypothetical protein
MQGQIIIPAGQTTVNIRIKAYSDFFFEDDETIVITLQGAGTQVDIGTVGSITITLDQEDGKAVVLFWEETYTTVDMDMFLWIGELGTPIGELDFIALSAFADFEGPELIFIPGIFDDASFGTSYIYYEGNEDPMDFEVQFVDFAAGVPEVLANRDVYNATYTLVNINKWDEDGAPTPAIVQTFDIDGGVYTTPSAISIPSSGSRIALPKLDASSLSRAATIKPSNRMLSLSRQLKK